VDGQVRRKIWRALPPAFRSSTLMR